MLVGASCYAQSYVARVQAPYFSVAFTVAAANKLNYLEMYSNLSLDSK